MAESTDAMFTRLDVHNNFARWLVDAGVVDRNLFEQIWAEYLSDGSSIKLEISPRGTQGDGDGAEEG